MHALRMWRGWLAGIIAAAAMVLAIHEAAHAQVGAKGGDARVRRLLDEIGWKYDVDGDGDFKMTFRFEDDRTQLVYINSNTERLDDMEIREVWSPGFRTDKPINAQVAQELLLENRVKKLGAWRLIPAAEDKYIAVFAAHIDAATDAATLKSVVRVLSVTADEREKVVTNEDEF